MTVTNLEMDVTERRGPGLLKLAAVGSVLLVVGVAASLFLTRERSPEPLPPVYEPIPKQTVNVSPGGYLQAEIVLQLRDDAARAKLRERMPEASAAVGRYLSSLTSDQAMGGFNRIEAGLTRELTPILGTGAIKRVLFQYFVIQ